MSNTVTVEEFAGSIGVPLDKLQIQLKEAGLSLSKPDQAISDAEKRQLLEYLQARHGQTGGSEVVLNRKKTSKVSGVKVVVRKQRKIRRRTTAEIEEVRQKALDEEALAAQEAEKAKKALELANEEAKQAKEKAKVKEAEEKEKRDRQTVTSEVDAKKEESKDSRKHKKDVVDEEKSHSHKKAAAKKKDLSQKFSQLKADRISLSDDDLVEPDKTVRRKKKVKKSQSSSVPLKNKHLFTKPTEPVVHEVLIPESISVADLAQRMSIKAAQVIRVLMKMGDMATINQILDKETAVLVVEELGHTYRLANENALEDALLEAVESSDADLVSRAPVVTIMGHVDHGKTSLLDCIRRTSVTEGEAGGITQHIGAYHVETGHGMITFLDTPGHAAFTAMRARGVKVTDIVILVVAADDGVMPQTLEAIQHAKAAEVPIIVAVNKIDKPDSDPEKLKTALAGYDLVTEEWGGDYMFVNVSAKKEIGIDGLLDAVLLQSEVLELKAKVDMPATGAVVEARLEKGRGVVATVLVQNGTLKQGDIVLAGGVYGRVRAMTDENGQRTDSAGPAIPVEIVGLSGTPDAGDAFSVVEDERKAREVALFRQGKYRQLKLSRQQTANLENMFQHIAEGEMASLNIVLKTDVQGSLEALSEALLNLSTEDVKVKIVYSAVGGITESDANLALAANAVIFGFNVRADVAAKQLIEQESIDLHYHSVIYDVINEVKSAINGLTATKFEDRVIGLAEVRDVFRSSKLGAIAGCMVVDGLVKRTNKIRVLRDNVVVFEGLLESLRRFKEEAAEVKQGNECGIGVKNYNDVKSGDQIEVYETIELKPHYA
jgi:translation initiation factor IF-2